MWLLLIGLVILATAIYVMKTSGGRPNPELGQLLNGLRLPENELEATLLSRAEVRIKRIKAEEGVSSADIDIWWRMHPKEMQAVQQQDERFRMAAFMSKLDESGDRDTATKFVQRMFPTYESDIKIFTAEQLADPARPLPVELKFRVNALVMRMGRELIETEIARYGSMNAVVRSRIVARVA